jgi:hypothetical protein
LSIPFLLAAEPAARATVAIELSTRKPTIWIGEPLRCTAIWRAGEETRVMPRRARIMINRGAGFVEEWVERSEGSEAAIEGGVTVSPDRQAASTHIIAVGSAAVMGRPPAAILAFSEPGSYQVRLEYGSEYRVLSNPVSVHVVAPAGEDRDIYLRYVRGTPAVLSVKAWEYRTFLAPAFEASTSNYLAWPFVNVMRFKIWSAIKEAPDGFPVQGQVPALLTALAERDFGDSPFDEDRLELLAQMQDRTGRTQEAIATFQRVMTKYPNGQAAMGAQRRLEQLARWRPPQPAR